MGSSVIYILLLYAAIIINECPIKGDKTVDDKIVGGKVVNIEKFPYQVSLQYNGKHLCGGSIISDVWVLSAAHCLHGRDEKSFNVRSGSSTHNKGGYMHNVTSMIVHSNYNVTTIDSDISLLKVHPAFQLGSKGVDSINLATKDDQCAPGVKSVVSGWGIYYLYNLFKRVPNKLRAVKVPIVDREKCKKLLRPLIVTERMLCAGNMGGGKGACQGDSGGPLRTGGVLVGIVSWGVGCGTAKRPGVYTDVAYFREWITGSSGV